MSRDGYQTDYRLLDAIEAITGGNLDCAGECGQDGCDGSHPEDCADPAVVLWRDGGRENELRTWLDERYPKWRADAPLPWGADQLGVDKKKRPSRTRIVDVLHTIVIPDSQDGTILGHVVYSAGTRHLVRWQSGEEWVIETDAERRVIAESAPLYYAEAEEIRSEEALMDVEVEEIRDDA